MIKIALVDDHVILRKSLAVLIGMLKDFEVVIEAGNGEDFIEQLKTKPLPEIALLDITMPVMDGVETAKWIKQHHPHIKVVALSMIKNDLVVIRMLKNGARGYILKDCEPEELREALHQVNERGYYYNELITPKMKARGSKPDDDSPLRVMMNEKELAFLRWACTDKTYKEIADEMGVSARTVDGYRDALFQKLDVTTRVGLAIYAIKNNIVLL
ncbi:response regulator transcription factor [Sediminibacterium ginsengisoli]|uniref:DNA-binding response regulator, NarL/FixJ family, contains REC and HTH domains n=1 Tax=Sediminibacterium ginsengisoli TaxID=413434 RepID=A0A1T4MYM1_9BACT|nr:response regulator transcription factor [Sediminibacterium ginsengisoli]SJZ71738.1 DNA-binding response regulator, NarL/FixJ family, contains REC and HTH domains [Sediminibacterium ginsengisoli]